MGHSFRNRSRVTKPGMSGTNSPKSEARHRASIPQWLGCWLSLRHNLFREGNRHLILHSACVRISQSTFSSESAGVSVLVVPSSGPPLMPAVTAPELCALLPFPFPWRLTVGEGPLPRALPVRSSRRCRRRNKGTFHRLLPVASKRLFELWSIAPEMNLESAPDLRPPVEPWVRRTTWVGRAWDEGATEPG